MLCQGENRRCVSAARVVVLIQNVIWTVRIRYGKIGESEDLNGKRINARENAGLQLKSEKRNRRGNTLQTRRFLLRSHAVEDDLILY